MGGYEFPELGFSEQSDPIDALIARLNEATAESGLVFERDALDIERPEDWGAVEMTGTRDEWADGKIIDRTWILDIWAGVSDRGTEWLAAVENVLRAYGDRLWYRLQDRGYLHDVKKVLWNWRVELDWVPEADADGTDGTDAGDGTDEAGNGTDAGDGTEGS